MSLVVEKSELVVPGQYLGKGRYRAGYGVYKKDDEYYASVIGLLNIRHNNLFLVPLTGSVYFPKVEDVVIGKILSAGMSSWKVDIGGVYEAVLSINAVIDRRNDRGPRIHDISKLLSVGDIIMARIEIVDRTRVPVLSMHGRGLRKLSSGRLVEINPVKVPRVIGKSGSMISMIKNETNSKLLVGKNGRILIYAPNYKSESVIIDALHLIETQSHVSGLTDRIKLYLQEKMKN